MKTTVMRREFAHSVNFICTRPFTVKIQSSAGHPATTLLKQSFLYRDIGQKCKTILKKERSFVYETLQHLSNMTGSRKEHLALIVSQITSIRSVLHDHPFPLQIDIARVAVIGRLNAALVSVFQKCAGRGAELSVCGCVGS